MGLIKWVGRTYFNYQSSPQESEPPAFLMALDESTVLDVAFSSSGLPKNPIKAAIATVSPLALRTALAHTSYNPPWQPTSVVIQQSIVSFLSPRKGIEVQLFQGDDRNCLRKYCPDLANIAVIEGAVIGEFFELNGVIIHNQPYFFRIIKEVWNQLDINSIRWQIVQDFPSDLITTATDCLSILGMNNTAFSMQITMTEDGCKINQVRSCINTAIGTFDLLSDIYPLAQIEQWASQSIDNVCTLGMAH